MPLLETRFPHTKKSHSLTSHRRQGLTQSSYILRISKWLHLWIHVHFHQKLTEKWGECMSDQWEVFHHICRITDSLENIITWQRIPPWCVLHKTLMTEFSYASCNTQFHGWKDWGTEILSLPRITELFKIRANLRTGSLDSGPMCISSSKPLQMILSKY